MNYKRTLAPRLSFALGLAILFTAAPAQAASMSYEFFRGADLPELGVSNYQGVADARLNSGFFDNNGGGDHLFAGNPAGNLNVNRSLIRFDLSSLNGYTPDGPATLRLRVHQIIDMGSDDFIDLHVIHPTNAGWVEGNGAFSASSPAADDGENTWGHFAYDDTPGDRVPWVNAAGTGDFPGLGAPGQGYELLPIDSVNQASYTVGDYVNFEIPAEVIEQMINDPFAGLLLRMRTEETGRIAFNPSEAGTAIRPTLTINASLAPAVPEPSMLVLLLGLAAASVPMLLRRRRL